ncbi:hypothetical protein [Streptomyces sp. NPDC054794]
MRQAFVHEAVVLMEPGGDVGAPGAAVTVALCGHWEHEPPCPLAPHHTTATRSGDELRLRVLFVAEPGSEAEVRSRIETALSRPGFDGPDGVTTRWQLRSARRGRVLDDEAEHAGRLLQS